MHYRTLTLEMVNLEIPSQYTFSPSEATPQLTINRDATIDLDSSNAFEGPYFEHYSGGDMS